MSVMFVMQKARKVERLSGDETAIFPKRATCYMSTPQKLNIKVSQMRLNMYTPEN